MIIIDIQSKRKLIFNFDLILENPISYHLPNIIVTDGNVFDFKINYDYLCKEVRIKGLKRMELLGNTNRKIQTQERFDLEFELLKFLLRRDRKETCLFHINSTKTILNKIFQCFKEYEDGFYNKILDMLII